MFFFQITMSKSDGVRTVVVGGKSDVRQDYCGTVGGQSTHFSDIDTEIKVSLMIHLLHNVSLNYFVIDKQT